jgi:NADPH:quinone reductase-like Zn-dependent oxidoreductase
VLTLGSGGVSLFALQFAKFLGARVIATTSSDDKAKRLKVLGADDVINYHTTQEWHTTVLEMTAGQGVDRVIEVGGAGTLEQSIKATTVDGQISMVGWLANATQSINISVFTGGVFTLRRIALGNRAHFLAMNRAISLHRLKPVIDRVFPFEEARTAHQYFAEHAHVGKVIISQN